MFKVVNAQGLILDLNPKSKITVEKNNPLFNDSTELFQDVSYPCKAGFTKNNMLFFGMGQQIEASNTEYRFAIQVYKDDEIFLTGDLVYSVREDGYEFNLEPNLIPIRALLDGIKMTDIRATDFKRFDDWSDLTTMMKDTCINPAGYPYHFFPIYNVAYNTDLTFTPWKATNHYDVDAEEFVAISMHTYGTGGEYLAASYISPYYKLNYMLKQVAEYLGLKPVGSIFSNDDANKVVIYTREFFIGNTQVEGGAIKIMPSNNFMPGMLIYDFLFQSKESRHLALDFNLSVNELEIESFRSIYESEAIDISQYIGNVIEQELPTEKGFTVTLKSDDQDRLFEVDSGDGLIYPPIYQLVAGDGSTPVEQACSTLRPGSSLTDVTLPGEIPAVDQVTYSFYIDSGGDYNFPESNDMADFRPWPLRFLKWKGYNLKSNGKYYPEAAPLELDDDDILWYRFLSDSRRQIITADFPPAVLAGLKSTRKYTYKTSEDNYCDIIIEKMAYDFDETTDLVSVQIYARTLNFDINTKVVISPVANAAIDDYTTPEGTVDIGVLFKACFDPILHGITQVEVDFVCTVGDPGTYKMRPITVSTNLKGAGGAAVPLYRVSTAGVGGDPTNKQEVRIKQGHPRYMIYLGERYDFQYNSVGEYYYLEVNIHVMGIADYYTIFF